MSTFDPFFKFMADVLSFFYSVVPSYGLSIIMLTIVVMVIITPLTYKSTKSMLQMQRLQPELKRIQAQHKGDRERLNQELMAFYKEHNLNPLGGCLPLLIQGPVFLVLYRVLHGLTTRLGGPGSGSGHIAGQIYKGMPLTPWRVTDQPFNPTYVNPTSDLFKSLSNHSRMNFLGIDLSLTPIQAFRIGILVSVPFVLLIVAMTAAQVVQNRQIQGRNKNQTTNPQQQAIMKLLPFMLPVISLNFPAGLGLYYLIQSLARIGTQAYITKSLYGDHHEHSTSGADASDDDGDDDGDEDGDGSSRGQRQSKQGSGSTPSSGAAKGSTAPKKKGPPAKKGSTSQGAKPAPKPGTSARSQAAQRKAGSGSGSGQASGSGRKSGAPRARGPKPSSNPRNN